MSDRFLSVREPFHFEDEPTKGSRFVGSVAPAANEERALAFLEEVRARFPDASHHAWAYRLGRTGDVFRFHDDGEPGGSAGRPILAQLEGHGVTAVVAVVTRWFGGTKLGVGGLVRAYGGAAGRALDLAPLETVVLTRRLRVTFPYEATAGVQGWLAASGFEPRSSDYGEEVRLEFDVPEGEWDGVRAALRDATAGRIGLAEVEEEGGSGTGAAGDDPTERG